MQREIGYWLMLRIAEEIIIYLIKKNVNIWNWIFILKFKTELNLKIVILNLKNPFFFVDACLYAIDKVILRRAQ